MGKIHTTIDRERGFTRIEVEGEVTAPDLRAHMVEYNRGEVTRKVLWDFRKGTGPAESGAEAASGARATAPLIQDKPGRRTALVGNPGLAFGLLRRWQSWLEVQDIKLELRVFSDIEAAMAWLDLDE